MKTVDFKIFIKILFYINKMAYLFNSIKLNELNNKKKKN